MTPADFEFLAGLMKRHSGVVLGAAKSDLTRQRLHPVAERYGFRSEAQLVAALRGGHARLEREAVAAMTTNETWFFRDRRPFERFQDMMLPALLRRRASSRRIRLWSAGASQGQEPYSLAMILEERKHQLRDWDIELIATEISEDVVRYAERGLYRPLEVRRGLSAARLMRHFRREDGLWRLKWQVRARVGFQTRNLLDPFEDMGRFDVIFCRNVLIYFDHAARMGVLARLGSALAPDGYLVMGAAETVLGFGSDFVPCEGARGVFVKAGRAAQRLTALAS
ncbi:MAG: CheR family methyltransferase [Alphaproteobacteria bacterium]